MKTEVMLCHCNRNTGICLYSDPEYVKYDDSQNNLTYLCGMKNNYYGCVLAWKEATKYAKDMRFTRKCEITLSDDEKTVTYDFVDEKRKVIVEQGQVSYYSYIDGEDELL